MKKMGKLLKTIIDAIYPNDLVCAICSQEAHVDEHGLCADCVSKLEFVGKIDKQEYIDDIYCAVYYTQYIAGAMHNFKYNDARYLCRALASLITLPDKWDIDCIVPIPLHKSRRRKRGYNQSTLIAEELCKRYDLCIDESLVERTVNTQSQRTLGQAQRAENIIGAFSVTGDAVGKRILIIDDVFTTGATMNECAKALKNAGASKVYAATVCMAKKPSDN